MTKCLSYKHLLLLTVIYCFCRFTYWLFVNIYNIFLVYNIQYSIAKFNHCRPCTSLSQTLKRNMTLKYTPVNGDCHNQHHLVAY